MTEAPDTSWVKMIEIKDWPKLKRQWVLYARKVGGPYGGTWQARRGGSLCSCWQGWREDRKREFDRFRLRRRWVSQQGIIQS